MLSYQHSYHAGNFADVVKHLVLTNLIVYLNRKEKPFFYYESHAGRGIYDLHDSAAQKTQEAESGICLLWKNRSLLPSVFNEYINVVDGYNPDGKLRFYPGSPALAIKLTRPTDRLYLNELHPQEFKHLANLPKSGRRVFCNQTDGLTQLKSVIPPQERRGLIFIDPAYEVKEEYSIIIQTINLALQRFSTGVYGIWYPIINGPWHKKLVENLSKLNNNYLQAEFYISSPTTQGMYGCGVWIINPPYLLETELREGFGVLKNIFNPEESFFYLDK